MAYAIEYDGVLGESLVILVKFDLLGARLADEVWAAELRGCPRAPLPRSDRPWGATGVRCGA